MKNELIDDIQIQIKPYLNQNQYLKLTKILIDEFENIEIINRNINMVNLNNEELLNMFLSAKGVEGCSNKTLNYYRKTLEKMSSAKRVNINIKEVKNVDLDAKLVAESIALQLEKRAQFRRVMKAAMQRTMRAGAVGIKTMVSGRLDGAEIARSEHYHEGSIPLQTLRADIDYAHVEANTTFGVIGVKVWIYKGDIIGKVSMADKKGEN